MLLVKKYGGSSVSTPEKILEIAQRLKGLSNQGHKLIVIVSAMGDTTDDLISLCDRITTTPVQRELDMLLSSGERIAMALLAIALNSIGCDAISFTGSQSGVFTDGSHNNARIKAIKPLRVQEELEKGRIVIIAGFQGVNPETKEVTTLGRGGSDTTAVAMAAQFKAERCDILTDVRGVFTIDPRISGVNPLPLENLDYEVAMEMTYWGARVLHYRSVELAERTRVPILVHLSSEEGSGTLVTQMEERECRAVTYNGDLAKICFDETYSLEAAFELIEKTLEKNRLPSPQILLERKTKAGREIVLTSPKENLENLSSHIRKEAETSQLSTPLLEAHWGSVTLTGRGFSQTSTLFESLRVLKLVGLECDGVISTPLSLSFIVPQSKIEAAARALHQKFIK
jgi:aspartate kinase